MFQTLSLKSQNLSTSPHFGGAYLPHYSQDIAANMFSYVFMVYILQFNGTILSSVGLEFLGLGPTGDLLGLVLQNAVNWNSLHLGMWWWTIIQLDPTLMIVSLYHQHRLDEVFNPRLRRCSRDWRSDFGCAGTAVIYRILKGDVKAVDGVSFQVRRGEILGIAGESGCGRAPWPILNAAQASLTHIRSSHLPRSGHHDHEQEAFRKRRLKDISIIPQYALDALSSTKKSALSWPIWCV